MLLARVARCVAFVHALLDAALRDRAIGRDVIGIAFAHALEHRPTDLHGVGVILGFHAPRAVVSRATLDRIHGGLRDPFERFPRLLTSVLHTRVTRDVIAHLAKRLLEIFP